MDIEFRIVHSSSKSAAAVCGGTIVPNTTTPECKKAWRLYYLTTSGGDGNGPASVIPNGGFIDPYNSWGPKNEPFWKMLAGYTDQRAVG